MLYPQPQNVPDVSRGMNVGKSPKGNGPKATDVSQWYVVYPIPHNVSQGFEAMNVSDLLQWQRVKAKDVNLRQGV